MSSDTVPDGPFTQERPSQKRCGDRANHDPHVERKIEDLWGGPRGMWYSCPGWETTHTVTVTAADGRVVGTEAVDLRELRSPDRYLGTNTAEVVMTWEAAQENRALSVDELEFGVATSAVAPQVCPEDCDRCQEHLYPTQECLEEEAGQA